MKDPFLIFLLLWLMIVLPAIVYKALYLKKHMPIDTAIKSPTDTLIKTGFVRVAVIIGGIVSFILTGILTLVMH